MVLGTVANVFCHGGSLHVPWLWLEWLATKIRRFKMQIRGYVGHITDLLYVINLGLVRDFAIFGVRRLEPRCLIVRAAGHATRASPSAVAMEPRQRGPNVLPPDYG